MSVAASEEHPSLQTKASLSLFFKKRMMVHSPTGPLPARTLDRRLAKAAWTSLDRPHHRALHHSPVGKRKGVVPALWLGPRAWTTTRIFASTTFVAFARRSSLLDMSTPSQPGQVDFVVCTMDRRQRWIVKRGATHKKRPNFIQGPFFTKGTFLLSLSLPPPPTPSFNFTFGGEFRHPLHTPPAFRSPPNRSIYDEANHASLPLPCPPLIKAAYCPPPTVPVPGVASGGLSVAPATKAGQSKSALARSLGATPSLMRAR